MNRSHAEFTDLLHSCLTFGENCFHAVEWDEKIEGTCTPSGGFSCGFNVIAWLDSKYDAADGSQLA